MGAGEVTPDEAATIASVFELRRRALETEEFELRLLALEQRDHGGASPDDGARERIAGRLARLAPKTERIE